MQRHNGADAQGTRMPARRLRWDTIHGLAGSSHLFGVLPALAFSARIDSMLYLAGFGVGAMAGMTAFAAGVGLIAIRSGNDHRRYRGLLYASSAAALVIGGFWLVGRRSKQASRRSRRVCRDAGGLLARRPHRPADSGGAGPDRQQPALGRSGRDRSRPAASQHRCRCRRLSIPASSSPPRRSCAPASCSSASG